MIKDWKSDKDDELPRFPDVGSVKLDVSVKISNWAPALQKHFLDMSDAKRESLVLRDYSVQRLKEVGASAEEIREIWGD